MVRKGERVEFVRQGPPSIFLISVRWGHWLYRHMAFGCQGKVGRLVLNRRKKISCSIFTARWAQHALPPYDFWILRKVSGRFFRPLFHFEKSESLT